MKIILKQSKSLKPIKGIWTFNSVLELRKEIHIVNHIIVALDSTEVEKINNLMEYWAYVQLEDDPELTKQLKYMVSTYGRVFNYKNSRLLTIDSNGWSSKVASYRTVSLFNGTSFLILL